VEGCGDAALGLFKGEELISLDFPLFIAGNERCQVDGCLARL
jgi:hypothetical protein